MSWYNFIDFGTPLVFSPKVMPDPTAAGRLQEKFQRAIQQLSLEMKLADTRASVAAKSPRLP